MSKQRLVITAVLAGQTQSDVARRYGVSQGWISKLITRWQLEGEAAFEPRSRRPNTSPTATPPETIELVVGLRHRLSAAGLDAGADTIGWHLTHTHHITLNRATIHRILTRHGLVEAEPQKRPKSSYLHFAAEQPNECWQSDFTHYRLSTATGEPGADTEIITWLDDHSRYALHLSAHPSITTPIVLATFRNTLTTHGIPASTLTDNGMVFTTRLSGIGRAGGRNAFEAELRRLNIDQKNSRPGHPTTQGKVERFQQTMKNWLHAATPQPTTITELQQLLDQFAQEYNNDRPHRATPATIYQRLPKATPTGTRDTDAHERVRRDRVDDAGSITLRVQGRMHHIGIGRTHARTPVIILAHDLNVRVVNAATEELLRELTINQNRDYQPQNKRNP
jgi:transposase InsO family protein